MRETIEKISWGGLDAIKDFLEGFPDANRDSKGEVEYRRADDGGWLWTKTVRWGSDGIEVEIKSRGK